VQLENRYDFTNFREVGIAWSLGNEEGKTSVDIRPHEKGTLSIRPKRLPVKGSRLTLTFTDPRGFVCETEELHTGPGEPVLSWPEKRKPATKLDSTETRYLVRGEDYACEIDRTTGQIVRADIYGRRVLVGGPELMILPLQSDECLPNHRADIPPLNNTCTQWRQKSVQAGILRNGAVQVVSSGMYAEAEGSLTLTFEGDGELLVEYNFRALQDINPRQWGMVFYTPVDIDSLSWQRNGQWTVYPPDHIGRRAGSAVAHPRPRDIISASHVPAGAWSSDANELGTNDFRSTKSNVISGSLLSGDGYGISLPGSGPVAFRAFVDGEKIGLLLAGFNTGGGEQFFAPHYSSERKPLKAGDIMRDRFTLQLIHR
ncbi:glycoside hydrolase family 2, partial [bacterium]